MSDFLSTKQYEVTQREYAMQRLKPTEFRNGFNLIELFKTKGVYGATRVQPWKATSGRQSTGGDSVPSERIASGDRFRTSKTGRPSEPPRERALDTDVAYRPISVAVILTISVLYGCRYFGHGIKNSRE